MNPEEPHNSIFAILSDTYNGHRPSGTDPPGAKSGNEIPLLRTPFPNVVGLFTSPKLRCPGCVSKLIGWFHKTGSTGDKTYLWDEACFRKNDPIYSASLVLSIAHRIPTPHTNFGFLLGHPTSYVAAQIRQVRWFVQ